MYNSGYSRQPPRRYFAPLRHVGSPVGWAIWVQTHRRAYPRRAHRDGVCLIRRVESRRRGETCSGGSGEWAQPGWYVLRRLQGGGVVQPRRKRLGAIVWQVLSSGCQLRPRGRRRAPASHPFRARTPLRPSLTLPSVCHLHPSSRCIFIPGAVPKAMLFPAFFPRPYHVVGMHRTPNSLFHHS